MQPPLREILDFAVEAAHEAGAFTLRYFNAGTPHEMKADRTPVTEADRGAERLLRRRIESAFPTHGIVGEEFGEKPAADPATQPGRWILDPVDGTFSFICGVPLYSVLVGFEWAGEMAAGVIHMPALRETVYAARGLGCWWRRPRQTGVHLNAARQPAEAAPGLHQNAAAEPGANLAAGDNAASTEFTTTAARVSGETDLARARLLTTGTKHMYQHGRGPAFERLRDACYADRAWSDAYAYALVATGRAEIALDPVMCLWDVAPLAPILAEAGGTLTDWTGRTTHLAGEAVATNRVLLKSVLDLIRG